MIPEITETHLVNAYTALDSCSSYPAQIRAQKLADTIRNLGEVEHWLVAFARYLCGTHLRLPTETSVFYPLVTSIVQKSTFEDFVNVLRHYHKKQITHANERVLVEFLIGCTEQVRNFYLLVLEQPMWLRLSFRTHTVGEALIMNQIDPVDIYGGKPAFISEDWNNVTFPLIITTVPSNVQPMMITLLKGKLRLATYQQTAQSPRKKKRKAVNVYWLKDRHNFRPSEEFILFGYADMEAGNYYPIDHFASAKEYRAFSNGKLKLPYKDRLQRLDQLLKHNYIRQFKPHALLYCDKPSQVQVKVAEALATYPNDMVLFADAKNRPALLPVTLREGVVEGLWEDMETLRGLQIWNRGRLLNCGFDFSGIQHALLYHPEHMIGKQVTFAYFRFQGIETGAVVELKWDQPKFKPSPYMCKNGSVIRIESCVCCCKSNHVQEGPGLCNVCFVSQQKWFAVNGTEWFRPGAPTVQRRIESGWTPEFFNNIGLRFRSYRLVASECGEYMRFVWDDESHQKYLSYLGKGKNKNKCIT